MASRNSTKKPAIQIIVRLFLKFTSAGAIGTAVHYISMLTLIEFCTGSTVFSSTLGAILGAITNFTLSYQYVFRSAQNITTTFTKFLCIAASGIGVNALAMHLFTNIFHMHYAAAQLITTAIVLFWGFVWNSLWTFKKDIFK